MRPDSAVAPFTTVRLEREAQKRTAWDSESRPEAVHVPNQDVAKKRGCHRQGRAETWYNEEHIHRQRLRLKHHERLHGFPIAMLYGSRCNLMRHGFWK